MNVDKLTKKVAEARLAHHRANRCVNRVVTAMQQGLERNYVEALQRAGEDFLESCELEHVWRPLTLHWMPASQTLYATAHESDIVHFVYDANLCQHGQFMATRPRGKRQRRQVWDFTRDQTWGAPFVEAYGDEPSPLAALPNDVQAYLMTFLPVSDVLACAGVSRHWRRIALSDSVWRPRIPYWGANIVDQPQWKRFFDTVVPVRGTWATVPNETLEFAAQAWWWANLRHTLKIHPNWSRRKDVHVIGHAPRAGIQVRPSSTRVWKLYHLQRPQLPAIQLWDTNSQLCIYRGVAFGRAADQSPLGAIVWVGMRGQLMLGSPTSKTGAMHSALNAAHVLRAYADYVYGIR